jgi:hypothetical protein
LLRKSSYPVVIGQDTYLPALYYAADADRQRLFVAVDVPVGSGRLPNTGSIALSRLRKVAKLQAIDYPDLRGRLPEFCLYRPDPWLVRQLKDDGASVAVHESFGSLEDAVFIVRLRSGG